MKTYNDKIATLGIVVAIMAIIVSILTPEIRNMLLGQDGKSEESKDNQVLKKDTSGLATVPNLVDPKISERENLLQTSSNIDMQRNKFVADSVEFENQKKIAAEQNRREKERLEAENRRIEIERQRLVAKEAEINNKPIQPSESSSIVDEIPGNCYILSIQSELFGFRTRKLTQSELNACNQCQSYVYSDGTREYEDMSKSSCILKKRIDDETDLGSLRNGAFVQLLNRDGSFYRVRDVSTGKIGYIAGKYAGVSTLVKTSCK